MKKKFNINKIIIICLFICFIISIISIYSTLTYLPKNLNNLVTKQIIFYGIGIIFIAFILLLGNNKLLEVSFYIYICNIILLCLVLIFGTRTNGIKAWFYIPLIGSFQPSEFMKIGLILFLAKTIDKSQQNNDKEIKIILKVMLITLIPSILTFLEPDTGAVIVYFIIAIIMLFTSGIKMVWFIIVGIITVLSLGSIIYIYLNYGELFINLFGSSLFYRLDRLFDFVSSSGMQLENSLISISSSGIFGHGLNKIPIYFPELQTDFIFASFTSCFGFIGCFILITTFIVLDNEIIKIGKVNKQNINKFILSGIVSVIIYQQIQNISMTIGLMPITGITLPFISYGGSSLLSFMILIGIVLNISKEKTNN